MCAERAVVSVRYFVELTKERRNLDHTGLGRWLEVWIITGEKRASELDQITQS